jgi:hypothetical protein
VHGGSRKTNSPRKLAHRRKRKRKRKFGKGREYCLIDRTEFHIWRFGRGGFLSAGRLSVASIFSHRPVCHSVLPNLPKRAYKIVVDGIESHPFHPEIEDDWRLVHQATDSKCPSLTPFFPKMGQGKGSEQSIRFWLQPTFLELPCIVLLTPRACGAASLMARCATPDVGHPIGSQADSDQFGSVGSHLVHYQ